MDDVFDTALKKTFRFLSFRPRTEKEILTFLRSKKVSQELHEKIVLVLQEHKFIDDGAFVNWWIEQRTKLNPRSERVLRLELRQKGVSDEVIAEVFTKRNTKGSEEQTIKKLIEKQLYKYKSLPKEEQKKKLISFLSRRGFSWDVINRVLKEGW